MSTFFQSAVKNTIIFSTALFSAFTFAQGKLAIVIDDIGYHPKEDAEILAMPKEISVAIIPAAPYAKIRNQEAKAQNHDILIHMPMQPVSNIKIEEGGLTLGLSEAQVNERVKKAKAIVPNAIGMNNHMGSAATADATLMTYLMTALREQHLFFLDSRTIGKSVAGKIAKEQGVRVLDRHIFLYVYEENRLNYTHKAEGKNVVDTKDARTDERLRSSVAEVYGHRTFVAGNSEEKNIADGDTVLANAPFTAKDADGKYTAGSKLNYVQYGRVTSKLHAVQEADLKDGKDVAQYGTKVASYGLHGQDGTEDNYFYRGVNNTPYSATLASDLKNVYFGSEAAAGKLHYQGHAVTYNLDKDYEDKSGLPNALGAEYALVSGTHVAADIDLASKNVTGNLYNVWTETNTQQKVVPHNVELANFNGTLANNGSISGSATKYDGAQGVLKASLYGAQAQELGGVISSNDTANNWGASFGAKVQNTPYQAPAVVTPPTVPAWGESTDQNNRK